ncbi:AraC family transcriptional regulator ligand-binding domain-containing protein [Nonomuraea sp. NPDC050663]|uniref:AraC family transcriptional regulator n=1 Tax=Nonomuraea sp. NPDC050663 TaxID=3364370 RepID=UPI0037970BA6
MEEATDCILLPKLLIETSGLDPGRTAEHVGIPDWAMRTDHAAVASACYLRTWELVEHAAGRSDIGLAIAQQYVVGALGLYDYLFITAPTMAEGFAATGMFMDTVSTNWHFEPGDETEQEISFNVQLRSGGGRGGELAMQFGLAGVFSRARRVTGRPISPVRVAFRQRAPRHQESFRAAFGPGRLEFDAPTDSVTLRKADMRLPFLGADPLLGNILRRYAETLTPPPAATSWLDRFRQTTAASLGAGPSLNGVAARLGVSPRTLQRRLADAGTTWRGELDRLRRAEFERGQGAGAADLTRRLGYADARSLSRAVRRWR